MGVEEAGKIRLGIIGCGNISGAYIRGCRAFDILEVAACADIAPEIAAAKAAEFDIPRAYSVAELLADDEIDIAINLTLPNSHAEVSLAAIAAGKHIYSEKPLATKRADGRQVLAAAARAGVLVGCAPDTFLGGGLQTCRKLLDDGWIGEPLGANAFMMGSGPESWHPNPHFFYQPGAGPLLDVGPYYLTALVHLLGPVARVTGASRVSFSERIATSALRFGERIPVAVPTYVATVMDFAGGPIGTLIATFDVKASRLPFIEIYGSEGTLALPDPNTFGGSARLRRSGVEEWSTIPLTHSDTVSRGIGVADMGYALLSGRPLRASGDLAFHVLEVMEAVEEASQGGRHIAIESRPARPAPLPLGLLPGRLDG